MSFKFLVTINSRCTTVEIALLVDGFLKNVLAQHLPDTLYIFYGNIYNMSRDKVEHYYLVTTAFLMSGMASSSLNVWNATWNPHKEDPRGC
jgi:hypothetical protein